MAAFVHFMSQTTNTNMPLMYGSKTAIEAASYILGQKCIPNTTDVFVLRETGITKKVKENTVYVLNTLYGYIAGYEAVDYDLHNAPLPPTLHFRKEESSGGYVLTDDLGYCPVTHRPLSIPNGLLASYAFVPLGEDVVVYTGNVNTPDLIDVVIFVLQDLEEPIFTQDNEDYDLYHFDKPAYIRWRKSQSRESQ